MTFAFGMFTLGAMLLYSAITNASIADIALGRPGRQPRSILDQLSGGATGSGNRGGTASGSTTVYKGEKVCSWIKPILERAEKNGWNGTVTSGYRTREQSIAACIEICGAPECRGTCAGASSNHNGCVNGKGAVDVTDVPGFEKAMQKMGHPLKNDLPNDRAHYSKSGH